MGKPLLASLSSTPYLNVAAIAHVRATWPVKFSTSINWKPWRFVLLLIPSSDSCSLPLNLFTFAARHITVISACTRHQFSKKCIVFIFFQFQVDRLFLVAICLRL
jgi:hypothetical protein